MAKIQDEICMCVHVCVFGCVCVSVCDWTSGLKSEKLGIKEMQKVDHKGCYIPF